LLSFLAMADACRLQAVGKHASLSHSSVIYRCKKVYCKEQRLHRRLWQHGQFENYFNYPKWPVQAGKTVCD
jgi:hypothetical protein